MTDICPVCGENFGREVRGRPKVYCSDNCRVRAYRSRHSQTVTITISREDAEDLYEQRFGCGCGESGFSNAVENAIRAALEGEK